MKPRIDEKITANPHTRIQILHIFPEGKVISTSLLFDGKQGVPELSEIQMLKSEKNGHHTSLSKHLLQR